MLTDQKDILKTLKEVLEQATSPAQLDAHPWVKSLLARQFVADHPEFENKSSGYMLLAALSALFRDTMPSTPPKRGKRLDSQWGQFGILAALYFAPLEFGAIRPARLVDAWGRIDDVILQFKNLSEREAVRYRLVGDEIEAAPTSTISDWHVRGLERLAAVLLAREQLLSSQLGEVSPLLHPDETSSTAQVKRFYPRYARQIWLGLAIIIVLVMGWKSFRIFNLYRDFKGDVDALQGLVTNGISLDSLDEIGPILETTREDVLALQDEIAPFGRVGRLLGWLPVYGGDLASASDLLDMAAGLVVAGDEAYRAGALFLEVIHADEGVATPSIPEMLDMLVAAQPGIDIAQGAVDQALAARANIEVDRLSPKTRPLLEKIDPYLPLLEDGLPALTALPKVLGTETYGPQTYLVLIQNEDEIRATGGFVTAAATITVENGGVIGFMVKDSYDVDDLSRFYAASPWQLDKFIGEPTITFRNVNWMPDFPTTAMWAEHLHAYSSAHSVDGVIAIGQEAVRLLLTAVGPLDVEGVDDKVTAENVRSLMRVLKDQSRQSAEGRKSFIGPLAEAIFNELLGNGNLNNWQAVANVMFKALDERHILVQIDDPDIGAFVATRGWDGAMRPGQGDYLMVVDTNLGWNKVNAVVQSEISYRVDLSHPEAPTSLLTTLHRNPTPGDDTCRHGYYFNPETTCSLA